MGIELGSNFDVKTGLPLDSRLKVANLTARDAIPSGIRYEGMLVYVVSEKTNYQLMSGIANGNWQELSGSGAGGGGTLDWQPDANAPTPGFEFYQPTWEFEYGLFQELWLVTQIPPKFAPGKQIRIVSKITSNDTATADILFRADTSRIPPGGSLTSLASKHVSTNLPVSISLSTVNTAMLLDFDLTTSDGKIAGNLVGAGDLLITRLFRDADTSTLPAKFLPKTSVMVIQ